MDTRFSEHLSEDDVHKLMTLLSDSHFQDEVWADNIYDRFGDVLNEMAMETNRTGRPSTGAIVIES
jgi:DNA topoisomerase VI subunit A